MLDVFNIIKGPYKGGGNKGGGGGGGGPLGKPTHIIYVESGNQIIKLL
jgi:hypothetical protein